MNSIKDRAAQIAEVAKQMNKGVYSDANVKKDLTPRHELQRKSSKVVTLEEAIKKSGLKDGMTISFHHHFRSGDKVINMVVAKLAEMGFKDLHLDTDDELEHLALVLRDMEVSMVQYVENLTKVTREKERISTELDLAQRIQENMLPNVFPPYPDRHDLDIHASMDPAKEVGGDFYDFFLIDHDHLGLVMADVAGKGIPAALFMMMARIMINYSAKTGVPPAEVLRRVNERICENNEAEMFVTVWLGILDMNTGEVVAANAGHEYPMLRGAKGDFVLRKDPHGFVVGGMEGVKFRDYRFTLERGGTLFLYTDGLPEANNAKGKLFGTDRVLEVLNANPDASAEQLLDAMTKAVAKYVGKTEQFDDLTMMAVRLLDLPEDSKETQNVVEPGEKDHKK